ncbi:NADP-dependent oxidoreductase domain-containing protein [Mycena maculata]|uniref:NADP-dependent oxidoreductase domain-containing protein n=1 Tax=Mycena maculata TaxID=230809 RepID=A0AAD7KID3_9AGAR|nr:NADP-dependent oxidoreductase domain-containing protein [Mycena maculata]
MAAIPSHFTLNNGKRMPSVGLGCWMGSAGGGQRVYDMCTTAIELGYRHFDTASGYGNEAEVGRAIKDSIAKGIPRSEIFLTTKLGGDNHGNVQGALQASLAALFGDESDPNIRYVDLYLMHWPQGETLSPEADPTFVDTWKAMERLSTDQVKSIGVSNFSIKNLDILLPHCSVIPVTNQVELHPCLPQNDLKEYCEHENRKILLTAYSPLGNGASFMDHPAITTAAKELGDVTPAQIALSWGVTRGTAVVPKSENPGRLRANLALITLSDGDMKAIDALHQTPGMHKSLLHFHAKDGSGVFGWTYEQLGWNMVAGGIVPTN